MALYLPLVVVPFVIGDRPAWIVNVVSSTPSDPLALLITYGPLGIFLAMLATGQFRTKYEVQRLEKQVEAGAAEIARLLGELAKAHTEAIQRDELNRAFQMQIAGHTLPALGAATRVFEAIPTVGETDALAEVRRLQEELAQTIASLKQRETP